MANILLLTYGNESSIEIVKSLAATGQHAVWGCHYDTMNAGKAYMTRNRILTIASPYDHPEKFVADVEEASISLGISSIVYTNCKMMKFVYDRWDELAETSLVKLGLLPTREALAACLDKSVLYEMFPDISPRVYDPSWGGCSGNFFGKPKYGSSAEGASRCDFLPAASSPMWDSHVFTEYLPGDEFTVDCVSYPNGKLYDHNARLRARIRDGITSYGSSSAKFTASIKPAIETIADGLKIPGSWFAQFKLDSEGVPKLMEVNSRVSGSIAITKAARKDYVAWYFGGFNGTKYVQRSTLASDQTIARHMASLPVARRSFVFDLDGTICTETRGEYHLASPISEAIDVVNLAFERGDEVVIHTARGMKRYGNDVAAVYSHLYDLTREQLESWGVKYDKLIMGKPHGVPVDNDGVKMHEVLGMISDKEETGGNA